MKNAIARKLIALISVILLVFCAAILLVINGVNGQAAENNAKSLLSVFEEQMFDGGYKTQAEYNVLVQRYASDENIRVSVIDLTGSVLADTRADSTENFENHSRRKEIIEANNGVIGVDIRMSDTFGIDYLYVAKIVKVDDISVILRISIPVNSINSYMLPILISSAAIFAIIILIVFLLSKTISGQLITPINLIKQKLQTVGEENMSAPIALTGYDEINGILLQVDKLSDRLDYALKQSSADKNKLNFVIENIDQGIIAVDGKQNAVLLNRTAAGIFDCNPSLPSNIMSIVHDKTVIDALTTTMESGQYQSFDLRLDGDRLFEFRILPTDYEEISAIIIVFDVSEIRKLQLEKQEFFQNASHELNTPLTSILGYSELLLKDGKYNETFLSAINKEASRMRLLISDMLKITDLESGMEITDEIIDFDGIIDDVRTSFVPAANAKNIEIISDTTPCKIKANYEKVKEVIGNLVDNAIKYTQIGGKIELTAQNHRGKLVFTIKDNGIGIPRQHLSRVFERFFRVDKGRSKCEGGTGLGLAIVKHICGYYNIPISIKSSVGIGTEISLMFEMCLQNENSMI